MKQFREYIFAITFTAGGFFLLFMLAPWLFTTTSLAPIDVDTEEWIPGNYITGACIVFLCSLIMQILWLVKSKYYKDGLDQIKDTEIYWYLGLMISFISVLIALFITVFSQEGSQRAFLPLIVIFSLAVAAIYWLPTASSTPGALKYIAPYSIDIRKFLRRL
ncbi:MAG: hypothetical protein AAGA80_07940 [Cyanobacteria bacterium P01_F01_bin.143]